MPHQQIKSDKLRLSYSKTGTFLGCRQKYHWIYDENLTPKKKSYAPSLGIVVHHLLFLNNAGNLFKTTDKELNEWIREEIPNLEDDMYKELLDEGNYYTMGHIREFESQDIKIVSPEAIMEADMGDYILYTRWDGIAQTQDERKWRMEYKTSARMDSVYLKGLRRGLQTGIAHLVGEELLEERIAGTLFSMLIKTKVPQFPIMPYTKERWVIDFARKCCDGVARDIALGDFYPSLDCIYGSWDCDYKPLCTSGGSQQVKDTFYTEYYTTEGEEKK